MGHFDAEGGLIVGGDAAGLFSEHSGLAGPLRLRLRGPDPGTTEVRLFPYPFAVLGRDEAADPVLDHPDVSGRHAYLQVVDGRLFCVDLGSREGTLWDDGPRPAGWVGPSCSIRIGPYHLRRSGDRGPDVADDLPPPTSRAYGRPAFDAMLQFDGPGPGRPAWTMSRRLVFLGRSPACKVQLPGPGVASYHAALVAAGDALWAVDLLGPGGIGVAGRRPRAARLADGDTLGVGPHRIRVRIGPVAELLPAPLPRGPATALAGLDDPVAAALLAEVGRMQDQMADQFQNALLTMFRLFSGMHGDQMALIRDELAQLHRLAEEQQSLDARLGAAPAGPPALRLVTAGPATGPGTAPPDAGPGPIPPPPRGAAGPEVHVQLARRLAAIQQERQGRWQRLLQGMLGKGPDRASS